MNCHCQPCLFLRLSLLQLLVPGVICLGLGTSVRNGFWIPHSQMVWIPFFQHTLAAVVGNSLIFDTDPGCSVVVCVCNVMNFGEWCFVVLFSSWLDLFCLGTTNMEVAVVVFCLAATGMACPWLLSLSGGLCWQQCLSLLSCWFGQMWGDVLMHPWRQ